MMPTAGRESASARFIWCCRSSIWLLVPAILGSLLHSTLLVLVPGSDSDFAGLCCFAESLSRGLNPSNPYFPPGYPALLWLGTRIGLTCLVTAALLNGLGIGLAIYHLAALWKRLGAGPGVAAAGGALLLVLPDCIWTFQAPHTDGLMLGLAAVWLHGGIAAWRGEVGHGLAVGSALAGALLVFCRWHMSLVVFPVLIVLVLARRADLRRYALTVGIPVVVALALAHLLLYASTGSLATSARLQVFTGLAYTASYAHRATVELTEDYADFASDHRLRNPVAEVGWARLAWHTLRNLSLYLTRKATMGGLLLFLLAGLLWRCWPKGAGWLVWFVFGYTLAISPTYFVSRASCLPEWCGLALLGAAFVGLAPRFRGRLRGFALVLVCLAMLAYALPRACVSYRHAVANRRGPLVGAVHELVDAPQQIVGWNDYSWCPGAPPWNLPAASLNRLWVDDPALDSLTEGYPRYTVEQITGGTTPVRVIIANERETWDSIRVVQDWARSSGWRRLPSPEGYQLWAKPDP